MTQQRSLFETSIPAAPGQLTDRERAAIPTGAPPEDRDRLAAQCRAILERLKAGPATNVDLDRIAQRFGARLYDLKKAGHIWTKKRVRPGVWLYTLKGNCDG